MVPRGSAKSLPLAIAWQENAIGGLWFNRRILVSPRFEARVVVSIGKNACYDTSANAIDGFTVILSKTNNYLNGDGENLGYLGIFDAIVTEVDLNSNTNLGDISGNAISIHKCVKSLCSPVENANTVQKPLPYVK